MGMVYPNPTMSKCTQCGNQLSGTDSKCGSCGRQHAPVKAAVDLVVDDESQPWPAPAPDDEKPRRPRGR
jgi:hypothetical protein